MRGRDEVPLPLIELDRLLNSRIRVGRSLAETEDLGQIEQRVAVGSEQVRLRDEPESLAGEYFRLADPVLPSEDLRAHSSP